MANTESLSTALFSRHVDALYVEAMVMADEARSYFDGQCEGERARMDMMTRLSFTCESLKVTTRLMHIIAWLLTQRAWQRGEMSWEERAQPGHQLGEAAGTDEDARAALPQQAGELVRGSEDLYARVRALQERMLAYDSVLEAGQDEGDDPLWRSPVQSLMAKIERSL